MKFEAPPTPTAPVVPAPTSSTADSDAAPIVVPPSNAGKHKTSTKLKTDDDFTAFHNRAMSAASSGTTRSQFFENESMTPGVGMGYLYECIVRGLGGVVKFPEPTKKATKPSKVKAASNTSAVGKRILPKSKTGETRPMLNVPTEVLIESGLAQGAKILWAYADGVFTGTVQPSAPAAALS